MYSTIHNFPRLSKEVLSQVSQKAPCARKTAPVKAGRRLVSCLCAGGVLSAVLALSPAAAWTQSQITYPGTSQTPPSLAPGTGPWGGADSSARKMARRMAKQRNTERQKKIVADTAKLLAMAQKLNDEVSHSTKNELSVDVVKQAAEIEKLAKSIKEKMRDGY